MSLADALAVSRAARNLVLVGDPRQLAQPLQGSHPPGVGVSALEHLLDGDVTIAPDRGVLLDLTWRMHPDVTGFVSRSFYEGRLGSEPQCSRQAVVIDGVAVTGPADVVRRASMATGCAPMRRRERVRDVIDRLTRATWRDDDGRRASPMSLDDIVVVAPYNAQVACLVEALPAGARVGTVDRFQGQEAVVSIFSMATSSVEDLPRNLEFLFSLNRLNVAVSRARGLSVLVCSPELLRARCRTPEQMRLVNALCRFVEMAEPWIVAVARGYAPGVTEAIPSGPPRAVARSSARQGGVARVLRRLAAGSESGRWTAKDNIAHLNTWREHAVRALVAAQHEDEPSRGRPTTPTSTHKMPRSTRSIVTILRPPCAQPHARQLRRADRRGQPRAPTRICSARPPWQRWARLAGRSRQRARSSCCAAPLVLGRCRLHGDPVAAEEAAKWSYAIDLGAVPRQPAGR